MPAIHFISGAMRAREPELRDPARAALARVGLSERADLPASALSHGEHRQLELAMALASTTAHAAARRANGGPRTGRSARMVATLRELEEGADHPAGRARHGGCVSRSPTASRCWSMAAIIASGAAWRHPQPTPQVRDAYLGEQEAVHG